MPIPPRQALQRVHVLAHGGIDYAEFADLGLTPDDVVDFSANLNPWGAPPCAVDAARKAAVDRYPDTESTELRRALARQLSTPTHPLDEDCLIAGNGSSELLWTIALAFLEPADRAAIVGPTFGEYQRAAQLAGAEVRSYTALPENDFRPDLDRLRASLDEWRPKLLFLCNPNNPTGAYLERDEVRSLCRDDRLLVLDEAYVGFVDAAWPSHDLTARGALVLRSMTKDYCLAGLRLGYAIAAREVIAALRKARPPWNVNAMAQAAGIACLGEPAHTSRIQHNLREAKAYLLDSFLRLGLRPIPSATSFFLLRVGDGAAFRRDLLRDGLLVRDCASFGLPDFIRIAARSLPECERLVTAVQRLMGVG